MNLQERIELMQQLRQYLEENGEELQEIKEKATRFNGWFVPEFIELAINNICKEFLPKDKLEKWAAHYHLDDNIQPKNIGIVMAGNIPSVGFHDMLCVFISGHQQTIKLSTKDDVLLKHLVQKMYSWEITVQNVISFADMLKGCDAYIATGSNNSGRYFEQYFAKYPHIIRRNRTSVAVITGEESADDLDKLSDDVHLYFGLGCRNVTKLFVPKEYDFVPLINAFKKYDYLGDHNKYKNNFDYQLSLALMNNVLYMTNGATLLIENEQIFSAISQVNYSYYTDVADVTGALLNNNDVQCIVGKNFVPFGEAQQPKLNEYADGVDTMAFLLSI